MSYHQLFVRSVARFTLALSFLGFETLFLAAISGCTSLQSSSNTFQNLTSDPDLSTFSKLVEQSGLRPLLEGSGNNAVLAPTNNAFLELPPTILDKLAEPSTLRTIVGSHIIPGSLHFSESTTPQTNTLSGKLLSVAKSGAFITVEDAVVTQTKRLSTGQTIYTIDRVLLPGIKR